MIKVPDCQELLLKIGKKTGSMKTLCMEARVKITHITVVGANCLSSSLIRALNDEGASCQELFTQDCEEDWKHEDIVFRSEGQAHPFNSILVQTA